MLQLHPHAHICIFINNLIIVQVDYEQSKVRVAIDDHSAMDCIELSDPAHTDNEQYIRQARDIPNSLGKSKKSSWGNIILNILTYGQRCIIESVNGALSRKMIGKGIILLKLK